MSHIWISHVWHVIESRHPRTYTALDAGVSKPKDFSAWVTSHVRMGRVTHINEARHAYERIVWHIWVSHLTHINKQCHAPLQPHSHLLTAKGFVQMSHVTHMNESYRTYEWVMSHIWTSHVTDLDSLRHSRVKAERFVYKCNVVVYGLWHSTYCTSHVTHMNGSYYTYEWVMSHIWMSHVTHTNESCHICEWVNDGQHPCR